MTEETGLIVRDNFDITQDMEEERLDSKALTLPTYDELTDERVVKEMQVLFKGFDFDPDADIAKNFKDVDQLMSFIKEGGDELRQIDLGFKRSMIMSSGAIMAKRWYYGFVIDKCMEKAAKGSGAVDKLKKAAGISTAYIYQFRRVGANLKMKDAYILGMYGVGWDTVRELATIEDKAMRDVLIKMYLGSIRDFNNTLEREKAKAALKEAIKRTKAGAITLDSADIKQIEAANNLETVAPEYSEAMKYIAKIKAAAKVLSKEKFSEDALRALDDCFIMENVPDAERLKNELVSAAEEAKKALNTIRDLLPDLIDGLTSVSGIELSTEGE